MSNVFQRYTVWNRLLSGSPTMSQRNVTIVLPNAQALTNSQALFQSTSRNMQMFTVMMRCNCTTTKTWVNVLMKSARARKFLRFPYQQILRSGILTKSNLMHKICIEVILLVLSMFWPILGTTPRLSIIAPPSLDKSKPPQSAIPGSYYCAHNFFHNLKNLNCIGALFF